VYVRWKTKKMRLSFLLSTHNFFYLFKNKKRERERERKKAS
jgi:hypothetical protein